MPRKTDLIPIKDKFLDRRTKMLPCQKERAMEMVLKEGYSINSVAKCFHVHKRTIQFLCFPERLEKNKQDRADRGGTMQYYNKEYHTDKIREHRDHKKHLFSKPKP